MPTCAPQRGRHGSRSAAPLPVCGELYVSNQGVSLLTGEVLRIDP